MRPNDGGRGGGSWTWECGDRAGGCGNYKWKCKGPLEWRLWVAKGRAIGLEEGLLIVEKWGPEE